MPTLRRHRRDHRARAPKRRKRRNLEKFIPEADSDFAYTATNYVGSLKRRMAEYFISPEEVTLIEGEVAAFRKALAKTLVKQRCTPELVAAKNNARKDLEHVIRSSANIIRSNPQVSDTNKKLLRIKVRKKKLGKSVTPKLPPRLVFAGSGDGVVGGIATGSGSGIHVLKYYDAQDGDVINGASDIGIVRKCKPDGAVRIEIFFDMVPPGEPVPTHPAERGWPKYLRSYTRSPMEVEYPIPSQPMLIVYWGRWADSTGNTSRWSKTCVARVEGWTNNAAALTDTLRASLGGRQVETKCVVISSPVVGELPEAGSMAGGDDLAEEFAAMGQRLLNAATQKLLGAE